MSCGQDVPVRPLASESVSQEASETDAGSEEESGASVASLPIRKHARIVLARIAVRHHLCLYRPDRLMLMACLLAAGLMRSSLAERLDLGTDRDAFTPSTHTVDAGTSLSESSYVYIDNLSGGPTNNFPEWLLRVGATENLEWRFGVNYGVGSQGTVVTSVEVGEGKLDGSTLYETSILYGFKLNTSTQDGWRPESAFIMEATTPVYGDVFGTSPVATYVAGWEFANEWRLDSAIRYAYAEGFEGWFSRWTPSVVLRMPVTDHWEVHAEWFGNYTAGTPETTSQPFFSPGTHYIISKNVEIGLRVGWALNGDTAPFFSDTGLAIRY